MRVPLRLRVVTLVTVFNLAVFGGGLAWVTARLSQERERSAGSERELVIERLQGLLERGGDRVARDVLAWPRWRFYEDALVAQLRESDRALRVGLLADLERVARRGQVEFVPRGKVVPLFPIRRGPYLYHFPPVDLVLPLPVVWAREPGRALSEVLRRHMLVTVTELDKHRRGSVWGAVFVPAGFCWPWELPPRLVFVGLSPGRQRPFDKQLAGSNYLRRSLETARRETRQVEIEGGRLTPLSNTAGETWGAAYLPRRTWNPVQPWPWNWYDGGLMRIVWPWQVFQDATVLGLPEMGFAPVLDVAGLRLNPMGSSHRSALFDEGAVLSDLRDAARADEWLQTERGLAVPLYMAGGELWGGVWLHPRPLPGARALLAELLPWFLATTFLLTLATFFGMHNLVLDPVRRLARGARRLATGDMAARVTEIGRHDELADLMRSFNTMAGQVEGYNTRLAREVEIATRKARDAEAAAMTQRRLAATGELAAGIAHEINNPLGGMLNVIEALGREDLDPDRRVQYLELLRGGLERIRTTVGGVLRLAPRETRTEPVSLADPVADALGLVAHRAGQQGVRIVLEGVGGERESSASDALEPWRGLPRVLGESNELGQAVLNLLVNALDSVEQDGGEVRVGLEVTDTHLHLWIIDDGPGMDPELLPRAADLFFTTKDTGRGTGLGLAIVHNVVGGHGGTIQLHNRRGGGFRVDIELPIVTETGP
jgi:signal transduction histidine kinase